MAEADGLTQKNKKCLNPVARTILQGLYDKGSNFSKLLGMNHILKGIWENVTNHWRNHIRKTIMQQTEDSWRSTSLDIDNCEPLHEEAVFYARLGTETDLVFPPPSDLNINMMPFIMAKKFRKSRLPSYLKSYWSLIKQCSLPKTDRNKIGFLTIQESYVDKNTSQRRPGLHTETPGRVCIQVEDNSYVSSLKGAGNLLFHAESVNWGGGFCYDHWAKRQGGIYMASNVPNSCKVWNCQIIQDENGKEIIGELGNIEHLREYLPNDNNEIMKENTMYWITDRTPHESLPLKEGTYRQFFRLVTSEVSIWYEDHSTPNPLGVVPDPEKTIIVKGSKFDPDGVYMKNSPSEESQALTSNLSKIGAYEPPTKLNEIGIE